MSAVTALSKANYKPTRRHSVAVIPSSAQASSSSPSAIAADPNRLSIPSGASSQQQQPRRNSLTPIGEASHEGPSKNRRRSVVVVSPSHDERSPATSRSSSRRPSVTKRPEAPTSGGSEEIAADKLIDSFFREADEEFLQRRRDSLPESSSEFASVMNEMASVSVSVTTLS